MTPNHSSGIVFDSKTHEALRAAAAQAGPQEFFRKETLRSVLVVFVLLAAVAACFLSLKF